MTSGRGRPRWRTSDHMNFSRGGASRSSALGLWKIAGFIGTTEAGSWYGPLLVALFGGDPQAAGFGQDGIDEPVLTVHEHVGVPKVWCQR